MSDSYGKMLSNKPFIPRGKYLCKFNNKDQIDQIHFKDK